MKKIATIIMITLTAILLSSCVINLEPVTHKMYFQNNSYTQHVYDWYLKDSNGKKYIKSDDYCPVPVRSNSYMSGLYTKEYQVWFCIYSNPRTDIYLHSNGFATVDSDTTFRLSDDSEEIFYGGAPRSAGKTVNENAEPELTLVDSKGNQYKLVTEIIYK